MKKLFAASIIALTVAGCSLPGITTVDNPLTKTRLAQAVSAYGVVLSAGVAYRQSCEQKLIPPSCRSVVVKLRNADKQVQVAINSAKVFVENNPKLDASAYVSAVTSAISAYQEIATTNGVVK